MEQVQSKSKDEVMLIPVKVYGSLITMAVLNTLSGGLRVDYIYIILIWLGLDSLNQESRVFGFHFAGFKGNPKFRKYIRGLGWLVIVGSLACSYTVSFLPMIERHFLKYLK